MCLIPASTSYTKMLGQNHFAERNPHVLTFRYQNFCLQCIGVVALSSTSATKFSHSGWRTLSQVIFLNVSLTKPIDHCLWSLKPQGGTQSIYVVITSEFLTYAMLFFAQCRIVLQDSQSLCPFLQKSD